MKHPPPPDECAQCGGAIPRNARACPHCGADERTGWRETSAYDGIDLPDEAWEEDSAPTAKPRPASRGPAWYWIATAAVLAGLCILYALGLR